MEIKIEINYKVISRLKAIYFSAFFALRGSFSGTFLVDFFTAATFLVSDLAFLATTFFFFFWV